MNVGFAKDFKDALEAASSISPSPHRRAAFPKISSELKSMDWQSLATFFVTKRQWGAFHGTELDLQLRRRGIQTIVLGGVTATEHGRRRSTARQAAGNTAIAVVLAEDATSGLSAQMHDFAIGNTFPRISRVVKSADLHRFLKPDSVAVYVFIHAASRRSLGSSGSLFRFCLPPC